MVDNARLNSVFELASLLIKIEMTFRPQKAMSWLVFAEECYLSYHLVDEIEFNNRLSIVIILQLHFRGLSNTPNYYYFIELAIKAIILQIYF